MGADRGGDGVGARLRAVREATGLTQVQFLARLNRAAEQLGVRPYAQSVLSRLENGLQQATFDDVAVYAAVDPLGRGKLWLGWGEEALPQIQPAGGAIRTHDVASARALLSKRAAAEKGAEKGAVGGRPGPKRRPKPQ